MAYVKVEVHVGGKFYQVGFDSGFYTNRLTVSPILGENEHGEPIYSNKSYNMRYHKVAKLVVKDMIERKLIEP